jgi:ketosteroid isomerase-like protein
MGHDAAGDELAVRNVVAALARTADGDDVDAYLALFAPDATWELPEGTRRGHDELRAASLERRAAGTIGPGSHTRHVVTTVVVHVDGDRATAESTWMFLADTTTAPRIARVGTYADEFRRHGHHWLLVHRTITYG